MHDSVLSLNETMSCTSTSDVASFI